MEKRAKTSIEETRHIEGEAHTEDSESDLPRMEDILLVGRQSAEALKLLVPVYDAVFPVLFFPSEVPLHGGPPQRAHQGHFVPLPSDLDSNLPPRRSLRGRIAPLQPPHHQPHLILPRRQRRPGAPPHHLHDHSPWKLEEPEGRHGLHGIRKQTRHSGSSVRCGQG